MEKAKILKNIITAKTLAGIERVCIFTLTDISCDNRHYSPTGTYITAKRGGYDKEWDVYTVEDMHFNVSSSSEHRGLSDDEMLSLINAHIYAHGKCPCCFVIAVPLEKKTLKGCSVKKPITPRASAKKMIGTNGASLKKTVGKIPNFKKNIKRIY